MANEENVRNLEAIKKLLQVSPGSTLLLRGHVDNARVAGIPPAWVARRTSARRR